MYVKTSSGWAWEEQVTKGNHPSIPEVTERIFSPVLNIPEIAPQNCPVLDEKDCSLGVCLAGLQSTQLKIEVSKTIV